MADEYTPTTGEVRADYIALNSVPAHAMENDPIINSGEAARRFDRWLAERDAETRRKALEEAAQTFQERLPDGTGNGRAYNSYRVAAMLRALAEKGTGNAV